MKKISFSQHLNSLAPRYGVSTVFSDLLTMSICALSMQQQEELYLETIKPYSKKELNILTEAFASMVMEMDNDGSGMVDILGEYFMEFLSFGLNGQFFTPMHICDMMAQINSPGTQMQSVLDPACGSGRMLMSMAKLNRYATFYGADCDANCAKMTVINMCLNGMYGEVAWMDSLANRWYGGWKIEHTIFGIPCIRKITEAESYIHMKQPVMREIPVKATPLPTVVIQETKQKQLVFEF